MDSKEKPNNEVLLESVRKKVKELEERLGYKSQGLDQWEQERLDASIHNANRMRGFIQPTDF